MSKIQKVFPTEEELSVVSSQVRCSAENCRAVFKSTSNLNMHLIRHHKVSGEELCKKDSVRQFYCPAKLCIYNKDSVKHFKKLKYLKQHFLKVHAAKNFICNKCDKKFATEAFKKMHVKNCGSSFHCSCGFVYNSMEALLTHCRRKGHTSATLNPDKFEKNYVKEDVSMKWKGPNLKKPERLICPKLSTDVTCPIHHIAALALSELSVPTYTPKSVDKGIQTEFNKDFCRSDIRKCSKHMKIERKQNSSQHTQTMGKPKNMKRNTETQTNIDYLKQKFKSPSKNNSFKKRKKSMETQTRELLNLTCSDSKSFESTEMFSKSTVNDRNEKFFMPEMLVDNLFQDMPPIFLKNNSNENNKTINDEKVRSTINVSEKSIINENELYDKKLKISMSPETSSKTDLFHGNNDLNICNKELEADLNELNIPCKKYSNDNESLYLMENGSYNVFDINKLCNIETQTEIDNFLTVCNEDSTFTLCSTTETQTIDLDPLLYSNMCTQTCDEVSDLFNFNFVDIETQTASPDL